MISDLGRSTALCLLLGLAVGAEPPAAAAQPAGAPIASAPATTMDVPTMLVRNALVALNQANLANDYTVLLKTSSVAFQRANTAQQLAAAFKDFRDQRIDLAPVVLFAPRWKSASSPGSGQLRLSGMIPSRPRAVSFDMLFIDEAGKPRLAGLTVGLEQPVAGQAAER